MKYHVTMFEVWTRRLEVEADSVKRALEKAQVESKQANGYEHFYSGVDPAVHVFEDESGTTLHGSVLTPRTLKLVL